VTYWTIVLIAGTPPITPALLELVGYQYVITAIHETIHHAGKRGYYTDEQLARAANELTKKSGFPEKGADAFKFGSYWDGILQENCPL